MYSQIAANKRKTVLMMALFMGLVVLMGYVFSRFMNSPGLLPFVLAGSLVYVLLSYYGSAQLALAMNGAREIQKRDDPRFYRTVENLAITTGLPMPKVYIIDDPAPNAFATGRDPHHAVVAATSGLLAMMDDNELEGVIAHELGHVKNYDIRVAMIAFALVAVVSLLADAMLRLSWFGSQDDDNNNNMFFFLGIVAAILAPLVATLIQLAISRRREYLADATGALTTRYPAGLASALAKIAQSGSTLRRQNTSTAHLFFANPLKTKGVANLFSTHPPVQDRIARLQTMGTHQ